MWREKRGILLRGLSTDVWLALVLVLLLPGSAGADDALSRLAASQQAAIETSPQLEMLRAAVDVRSAEGRAESAAGTPYLELQQEGVGSGFDWESNAQTTLRIGKPFNLPGHARARRELRDAADAWVPAAREAAFLETAAAVSRRWLDVAIAEERLAVARRRLARLDRAQALQRARLEAGELAGTDVTQIELARAGVASTVRRLESERVKAVEALRKYCAERCRLPRPGDLRDLREATATPKPQEDLAAFLEASPLWRSRGLRLEVDRSRARVTEATAWGRPEAELEWEHIPALEGLPGFDAFGVRFRFPLPAGDAGTQMREAAGSRKLEAEATWRVERARLMARLRSAMAAARAAEKTLDDLEPILEDMERAEHSLAEQFRLGAISYLVYIDGMSRFDDIRLEALEARRSLLDARLEMAILGGGRSAFPLPETPPAPGSGDMEASQ